MLEVTGVLLPGGASFKFQNTPQGSIVALEETDKAKDWVGRLVVVHEVVLLGIPLPICKV